MKKLSSGQDVDRCVRCNHERKCSDNLEGKCRYERVIEDIASSVCGCKCEFPSPSVSEAAPELRPCPFCGSHAHVDRTAKPDAYSPAGYFAVTCIVCDATIDYRCNDPQEAAERWNARVHQPPEQNSERTDLITTIAKMDICSRCNEGWECECPVGLCRAYLPVTEQNLEDKNSVSPKPKAPSHSSVVVEKDIQLRAGKDEAWPLVDVLRKLAFAAEHLGMWHDCDHHGYEEIIAAKDAAYRYVADSITQDAGGLPSTTALDPGQASQPKSASTLVTVDEAARRAAEKIVDEPLPSNRRFASFDLRKWKVDRFTEIIATELSVHQPDVQAAELLREGARDYATHAARLQSDGCESALSFAHDYNTKASVLREYADKIDALAASPVQVDEVSNLHLCVVCHVNGVSPEEGFDTCTDCAKRI